MKPVIIFFGDADIESDVFQMWMHTLGFELTWAHQLSQVLDTFKRHRQTIVVLKLMEPPARLIDLAQEIRSHAEPRSNPIFILTEHAFATDVPATEVFARPLRLSNVAKRIEFTVQRHA